MEKYDFGEENKNLPFDITRIQGIKEESSNGEIQELELNEIQDNYLQDVIETRIGCNKDLIERRIYLDLAPVYRKLMVERNPERRQPLEEEQIILADYDDV